MALSSTDLTLSAEESTLCEQLHTIITSAIAKAATHATSMINVTLEMTQQLYLKVSNGRVHLITTTQHVPAH